MNSLGAVDTGGAKDACDELAIGCCCCQCARGNAAPKHPSKYNVDRGEKHRLPN